MKHYIVYATYTVDVSFEVEAETPADARFKVRSGEVIQELDREEGSLKVLEVAEQED